MAIKVFPSANGVGGAGQKVLSEGNLAGWMMPGARNYVVSGLTLPDRVEGNGQNPVTLSISAGAAVIAGYCVVADSPITMQLPAPDYDCTRYYIYVRLLRDGLGLASSVATYYSAVTPMMGADPPPMVPTPPSGDYIYLGHITADGTYYGRTAPTSVRSPWPTLVDTLGPSGVCYSTFFDSVDGMAKSGTVTPGEYHVSLTTAASSGASASLRKRLPATMQLDMSMPYAIRMGLGYHPYGANIQGYAGIGNPATNSFVGISCHDGKIYGCRGDGTSLVETAQLRVTGTAGQLSADSDIRMTVADGKITWQAGEGVTVVADTYLPAGLSHGMILYAEVKTTEAAAKSMALSHWIVAQWG